MRLKATLPEPLARVDDSPDSVETSSREAEELEGRVRLGWSPVGNNAHIDGQTLVWRHNQEPVTDGVSVHHSKLLSNVKWPAELQSSWSRAALLELSCFSDRTNFLRHD